MAKRAGSESADGDGRGSNAFDKAAFDVTYQGMLKLYAQRDIVNEAIKEFRKKARGNGCVLGKLDLAIKKALWDPAELRADREVEDQYLAWAGAPVGTQKDMFKAVESDAEQLARDAWQLGCAYAAAGKDKSPPDLVHEAQIPFFDKGYDGEEFVWTKATQRAADKAAGAEEQLQAATEKPGGRKATPRDTTPKGAKAKRVAGMISPPPSGDAKEEPKAAGAGTPAVDPGANAWPDDDAILGAAKPH